MSPTELQIMKRRTSSPLSKPDEKKKYSHHNIGSPLPVPISTLTGVSSSNNYWAVYHGHLTLVDTRYRVNISDMAQARVIHNNGYFGEFVVAGKVDDKARPVLSDWSPGLTEESNKVLIEDKKIETVTSWSQIKANLDKTETFELHLELCEAFYLSYCLGCLLVSDTDQGELTLIQMWQKYRELEPDFPVRYRVYHEFRTKGWVVRSGHTMGADWVLYKQSPGHYHSTYCVRLELVDSDTGHVLSDTETRVGHVTWSELLGHNRVMSCVKKDLIVARVSVTRDKSDWDTPACINKMHVSCHRIRRWVPGDHRWKTKPKVPVLTVE